MTTSHCASFASDDKASSQKPCSLTNTIEKLTSHPPWITEPVIASREMNTSEQQVADFFTNHGWTVCRNGWPDLLVYKPQNDGNVGRAMAIEVKQGKDRLSQDQKACHQVLIRAGLIVHTVRPEDLHRMLATKGGRAIFSTHTLSHLKIKIEDFDSRVKSAESEVARLRSKLEEYRQTLGHAFIAFDSSHERVPDKFSIFSGLLDNRGGLFG